MTRISKNPEERQIEIMNVAWRLFLEKGYENTAISDIVKDIGVAQGTFYYYFKTKEAILNAILEKIVDEVTEKVNGILSLNSLNSIEKLKAVIGYVATMNLDLENITKLPNEDKNIIIFHKLKSHFLQRFLPTFTEVVKQGIYEGQFKTLYPEEAVKILVAGLGSYLHCEILVSKDAERLLEALEVTADIVERVLGVETGRLKLV